MDFMDWLMDNIVMPCMILLMALFVVGLLFLIPAFVYWAIQDSKRPTFELKKDDWECTNTYEYTTTAYVMVGKILLPSISHNSECIQWSKK